MPHTSELFLAIREAVLQHVFERQVKGRKWGVDYFWARKDVAQQLARPSSSKAQRPPKPPGQQGRAGSSASSRRFDWGFEMTFMTVIEKLAEEGLLEVRVVAPLAGGRSNSVRIRDYKLTEDGIRLCELRYGAPLPGEDSTERTPAGLRTASSLSATSSDEIAGDGMVSDDEVTSASSSDAVPPTRPMLPEEAVSAAQDALETLELAAAGSTSGSASASGSSSGIYPASRPSDRRPAVPPRRDTPSGRQSAI
ncbi:MAG: hypothetical protein AB7K09_09795 [Planctomycetota bacterium]